jgi:hypothetical protein
MRTRFCILLLLSLAGAAAARQPFFDRTHPSKVFGGPRNYRIFLPPAYETSGKTYPVIYYLHGHSDRYTLERYDNGTDTVPKIAAFVALHDAIVVAADGYVARDYTGFYGGSPWDVREKGGDYDFGLYFHELVAHIDSTYRTLTDRRHRATSGLSMGGFMSLFLSARYPDLIGSASAFNPAPEFHAGDKGRRVLWTNRHHPDNHGQSMVRLIRASGDYISQYHEMMREVYARAHNVDFEYRRDEYHKHFATSIGETFQFHMRAFANSALDNVPEEFSHANAYRSFKVWGYQVESEGNEPGITYLEGVRQGGLRVRTRRWSPDGPPAERQVTITTAPLYEPGKTYTVLQRSLRTGSMETHRATADREGRLVLKVDGTGHQIGIAGPGTGSQPPVLLPVTGRDHLRVPPGEDVPLPVQIFNPRGEPMEGVKVTLSSRYPTVRILSGTVEIPKIEPGGTADVSGKLRARFTAGAGYFAAARLEVQMGFDGWHSVKENIDVLLVPEVIPAPLAVEVLDGRTVKLPVFRQKGNQGGGGPVERLLTEGKGNGNGVLEPGEEATIWVKMAQGMDPFDKGNWYRAKIYTDSAWLAEVADIQEQKQLEWTGAQERTSVVRLAADAARGSKIPLLLDNESWTYHYTPDVRFGAEELYQAMQLHTHHLHRWEITVP